MVRFYSVVTSEVMIASLFPCRVLYVLSGNAPSMNKLVLSSLLSSGSSTIAVWNGGIGRTNDEDVGGINDDDVGGSVTTDGRSNLKESTMQNVFAGHVPRPLLV